MIDSPNKRVGCETYECIFGEGGERYRDTTCRYAHVNHDTHADVSTFKSGSR